MAKFVLTTEAAATGRTLYWNGSGFVADEKQAIRFPDKTTARMRGIEQDKLHGGTKIRKIK
jgi:hypothetical protein